MKWLRRGLLVLGLVVALVFLWARLLAGGPIAFVPGGALSGEPAPPPSDWNFANEVQSIDVESRAGWLPYSRRTWFMAHQGRLHLILPSLFGDGLKQRIDRDPRLRVRLEGRIYDQVATRVTDSDALGVILAPLVRRQFGIEISGRVEPVGQAVETWIYRLEDPPEGGA